MTLDTRFIIDHPVNAKDVFDFARAMIGATEQHSWGYQPDPRFLDNPYHHNHIGQGLPALLRVHHGADGPLLEAAYDEDDIHKIGTKPHEPGGFVEISLDTAYGYRGDDGLGCGQLHAQYVGILGRWCEGNNWPYHWQNEFSGEWFTDWRLAADELGQDGDRARAWFLDTVLPAIAGREQDRT